MQLKLKRTRIEFGLSFVIIITLMLIFFDEKIVLLSLLCSLLHECGHLLAIVLCREKIDRVVFGGFGLRIERSSLSHTSYMGEAIIALGGIFVNFSMFLLSLIAYLLWDSDALFIFGVINLFVAFMNSLPIKSLDMGKALLYFLLMKTQEDKAEIIKERVSFVFSLLFAVFTILYSIFIRVNFSLVAVSIYLLTETEFKIHGQ